MYRKMTDFFSFLPSFYKKIGNFYDVKNTYLSSVFFSSFDLCQLKFIAFLRKTDILGMYFVMLL